MSASPSQAVRQQTFRVACARIGVRTLAHLAAHLPPQRARRSPRQAPGQGFLGNGGREPLAFLSRSIRHQGPYLACQPRGAGGLRPPFRRTSGALRCSSSAVPWLGPAQPSTDPRRAASASSIKARRPARCRRASPRSRCATMTSALRPPCFQVARRHRSSPSGVRAPGRGLAGGGRGSLTCCYPPGSRFPPPPPARPPAP